MPARATLVPPGIVYRSSDHFWNLRHLSSLALIEDKTIITANYTCGNILWVPTSKITKPVKMYDKNVHAEQVVHQES